MSERNDLLVVRMAVGRSSRPSLCGNRCDNGILSTVATQTSDIRAAQRLGVPRSFFLYRHEWPW